MKVTRKEAFTIPNILGYIRLLLIPLFVYMYLNAQNSAQYILAACVLCLSGLTDLLDGYIARRFHMITDFGKVLDPIADKLTQGVVAFLLAFHIPYMWILLVLVCIKELFMAVAGIYLLRKGQKLNGAKWFGKVSTAVFYIVTVLLIAFPTLPEALRNAMVFATIGFMLLSFSLYLPEFKRLYDNTKLSMHLFGTNHIKGE
ncbi:MAG: CDP-alcohol phosphatidyltransferase family protein [Erysipelotrichaceae bacterium]